SGSVFAGDRKIGTFGATTASFRGVGGGAPIRVVMDGPYTAGAAFYSLSTRGVKTAAAFHPEADGMRVTRQYLTRDGTPVDPAGVRQGDLLICVTKVASLNGALDNVVVQNLIPAGLEVENPRLQSSETFTWLTGEKSACTNSEIRDDQVLFFVELPASGELTYYTLLRAVSPGTFRQPPAFAEAMYARANHVVTESGTFVVRPR
ncbi:MAG: hypothetical protein JWO56_422, partial [Acidobacteria bacterium]|nr:hypothetical protein [Acidobacteriota bacterium]